MSQLHFYVPDDEEKRLRELASQAGLPLSRYLAELVRRGAGGSRDSTWRTGKQRTHRGGQGHQPWERVSRDDLFADEDAPAPKPKKAKKTKAAKDEG
jgi:hypothetical protein